MYRSRTPYWTAVRRNDCDRRNTALFHDTGASATTHIYRHCGRHTGGYRTDCRVHSGLGGAETMTPKKPPTERQLKAMRYRLIQKAYARAKARHFEKLMAQLKIVSREDVA